MLKVGDWVTQYSAGYWQVVAIFAKYADEDDTHNGTVWKKGERVGEWVVLKKAFTPKMKPSNLCECVDGQWCRPVSEETVAAIEAAFAENPKAKAMFLASPNMPQPGLVNFWMNLPADKAAELCTILSALPQRFTVGQLWDAAREYRRYVTKLPATHLLTLSCYPWEVDKHNEMLCFAPLLKAIDA